MNNQNSFYSEKTSVQIDEQSYLAHWTYWQARKRNVNISGYGLDRQDPALFVSNEVLVDPEDRDLINELVKRHGATILPALPLPPRPDGLGDKKIVDASAMPLPIRLFFEKAPDIKNSCDLIGKHIVEKKEFHGKITVTSDFAARMIAMVGEYKNAGRNIGLNVVGSTLSLPLTSIAENHPAGNDPFKWQAFSGRSRIVEAWQLVESFRQINLMPQRTLLIGILDSGFWLNGDGRAFAGDGQSAADLGVRPLQLNLLDESVPAGGASGIPNGGPRGFLGLGNKYEAPWHGNGTASAATAFVGNNAGNAGSGGTVASPVLFKTDASISQILRCLQVCLAWGVDVLNMSISISYGVAGIVFPKSSWENGFQFASDNGLLILAAAGNDDKELPDYVIRPATRTPGVITVGALDIDANGNDYTKKASFSNYGSSVGIWAPGTNIPVAPNDLQRQGGFESGTSIASPIVAGVAAMMRYVDPTLNSDRFRQIIADTGWKGTDGVSPCMDAYAAVLFCMGNQLTPDNEPNDNPSQAKELVPIGANLMAPNFNGYSTLSRLGDRDWWIFHLKEFSSVTITGEWYQRLSSFSMELHPDDPFSRAGDDIVRSHSVINENSALAGILAPGTYRIQVLGSGPTAYRLKVQLQPTPILPDVFERNDSFESASRLIFSPKVKSPLVVFNNDWGPGTFDATLHGVRNVVGALSINNDFFRMDIPASLDIFHSACIDISQTDFPVDVILFDNNRQVIDQWLQVRSAEIIPPRGIISYLKISGTKETRYTIRTRQKINTDNIPGPLGEEDTTGLPPWWGDPMLTLKDRFGQYMVEVGTDPILGNSIIIEETTAALSLELLDLSGNSLRKSIPLAGGGTEVSTKSLESGKYVLRVARETNASDSAANLPAINMRLAPPRE